MGLDPITGTIIAATISGGFGLLGSRSKRKAGQRAGAIQEQASLRAIDLLETAKEKALELSEPFRSAALSAFQGLLGLAIPELPPVPKLAQLATFVRKPFRETEAFKVEKGAIQEAIRETRAARGQFFSGLAEQEEITAVGELIARRAGVQAGEQERAFQLQSAIELQRNQQRLTEFQLQKQAVLEPFQLQTGLLGNILNIAFPSITGAQQLITGTASQQAAALTGGAGAQAQAALQTGQAQTGFLGDIGQTIAGIPLTAELLRVLSGGGGGGGGGLTGQIGLPLGTGQQFAGVV